MICSCGAMIEPDLALGQKCRGCLQKSSHEALLEHQLLYLPKVMTLKDEYDLLLVRLKSSPLLHIELFGDRQHAYCGVRIDGPGRKRFHSPYDLAISANLCVPCRSQLRRLTDQIPQDESMWPFRREEKA